MPPPLFFRQELQAIVDSRQMRWAGKMREAKVWVGGDQPWLRRLLGVSTCPQVGSLFNEGIWDHTQKEWRGDTVRRSMESDALHHSAFQAGTRSLAAAGCSTTPILKVPRSHVLICILHCVMAVGRLVAGYISREAQSLGKGVQHLVQRLLSEHRTGLTLTGSLAPDGEETTRLLNAWEPIATILGLAPGNAAWAAVVDMRELMAQLYRTYWGGQAPPEAAGVARRFREALCPESGSWYLLFLERDCAAMLQEVQADGFGLAMFSSDVVESLNRLLKRACNDHFARGGGGGGWGAAMEQCMQWVFLLFDVHLLEHGEPRQQQCVNAETLEAAVPRTPAPPPASTSKPSSSPSDVCAALRPEQLHGPAEHHDGSEGSRPHPPANIMTQLPPSPPACHHYYPSCILPSSNLLSKKFL